MSSISSWDQRNTLYPEVFSSRCFTTTAAASMSKHRLRSALWKTDGLFRGSHHVSASGTFQCSQWPQSNILLFSAVLFVLTHMVHKDDWHDVSFEAWSLFQTSLPH